MRHAEETQPLLIGWDTETWLIAPGRLAPRLVCASFFTRGRLPGEEELNKLFLRPTAVGVFKAFVSSGHTLVAHNASFDVAVMIAAEPRLEPLVWRAYEEGQIRCTMIREKLLAIARAEANRRDPPASLEACVERYLGERVAGKAGDDSWRFRFRELDGVPIEEWPSEARRYAELDARYCLRIHEAQAREAEALTGSSEIPDEVPQTRAAWALHLASCWGVRCEPVRVDAYEQALRARQDAAIPVLEEHGLLMNGKIDRANCRDMIHHQYDYHGLGRPPLTPKGYKLFKETGKDPNRKYTSYSGDTLRAIPCDGDDYHVPARCSDEGPCGEPLHHLADFEAARMEISRYLPHLRRGCTEVLNPRINPVLATGRAAVSSPPLQQMPRVGGARECIVPRPGTVFIGADVFAAELITLAQVMYDMVGYSTLREVLLAGEDPHLVTAARLLGVTYEEASRRYMEGDPLIKNRRSMAKPTNFGVPGGMGPAGLVRYAWKGWGVRLTLGQATDLRNMLLEVYPELPRFLESIGALVAEGGGSFDLEQPYSGRLRGGVRYTDGCNTTFQGLAADAMKAACYEAQRECWIGESFGPPDWSPQSGALYGARIVLFVHDEIIAESPKEGASEAADRLAEIMVAELARRCPDLAGACRAEPWVARRWSKAVESMRGPDGQLIAWDA